MITAEILQLMFQKGLNQLDCIFAEISENPNFGRRRGSSFGPGRLYLFVWKTQKVAALDFNPTYLIVFSSLGSWFLDCYHFILQKVNKSIKEKTELRNI
jgi:hypothetical protein